MQASWLDSFPGEVSARSLAGNSISPHLTPSPHPAVLLCGRSGPQEDHVCIGKHTGVGFFFIPTHAFGVTSEKALPSPLIREIYFCFILGDLSF